MEPQPKPLSARQRDILVAIREFSAANSWPPSIRQICDMTGVPSTSTVEYHLKILARRGLITRLPRQSRALSLTYAGLAALEVDVAA